MLNKNTLYVLAIISLIVLTEMEKTVAAKYSYYQYREKPRSPRGFKSERLSTARGFGKRDPGFVSAEDEYVDSVITRLPKQSFPVQWLVEQIQNDPNLAQIFVQKFVDLNQDGEVSEEELVFPGGVRNYK